MAALNPITRADVIDLDPSTHAEERVQSLLHLWFSRYFSGNPFMTIAPDGGTEQKIFQQCLMAYQETSMKESPDLPVIHIVMPDRNTRRRDYNRGSIGHDDEWMIDVMVKVPHGLTATSMPGLSAEHIATRVGGQIEWLLGSTEREALMEHGFTRIKIERPSSILPASVWQSRMLVFSCHTRREQAAKPHA
ncbi:MAG: hypothetical protein EOP85_00170 [Verrucomicrobiaceae bacterium]|nr:MAG: hypothetical protein EOP85_00170 [Verrucomicrobiaceae bacterium]